MEELQKSSNVNNYNKPHVSWSWISSSLCVWEKDVHERPVTVFLFYLISNDDLSQERESVEKQSESITGVWGESLFVLEHVQVTCTKVWKMD